MAMRRITVTELRKKCSAVLCAVEKGESVVVVRRGRIVARLVPATGRDWRDAMPPGPKLLVPAEEAFAPMADELGE